MRLPFKIAIALLGALLVVAVIHAIATHGSVDAERARAVELMERVAPREAFTGTGARVVACGDGRSGAGVRRCILAFDGDVSLRGEAVADGASRLVTVTVERVAAEDDGVKAPPPREVLDAIARRLSPRVGDPVVGPTCVAGRCSLRIVPGGAPSAVSGE